MSITHQALWIIERNLQHDLTLGQLADACKVSKYHLARAFSQSTGKSVMSYVRGRRLTMAAEQLLNRDVKILDVALQAGYASHEAFTRAFGAQFGFAPEMLRERGSLEGASLVPPLQPSTQSLIQLPAPRVVMNEGFTAIGLAARYSVVEVASIPMQWQEFMMNNIHRIANKRPSIPLSIIRDYDDADDQAQSFEYICAAEVATLTKPPTGLIQVNVAARRYAVFEHTAHISSIGNTYEQIWNNALTTHGITLANAPTLERHHETFDPRTGHGGISIWIPME